jgi:Carbohydrate-selective porin, OprB family
MSRIAQKLLFALPAAYAASFFVSASSFAAPATEVQIADNLLPTTAQPAVQKAPEAVIANNENTAINPDATEVKPSDWQYTALQALASKFECKGAALNGAAVSRDSFVNSLNTCLATVEPLVAKSPSSVSTEEMDVLRRLTQEFRAELTNIDTRVEQIQKRTALAQTSQFSTTTKLKGEVVVGLNGVISGGATGSNATVSNRARLLLESTFTGKDRLYTRLNAQNNNGYGTLKNDTNANFPGLPGFNPLNPINGIPSNNAGATYQGNTGNSFGLDWLAYQFPLGNANVYAAAFGGIHSDYADTHSPYFQDFGGGSGALTSLAEESPIYKIGGGSGLGVTIPLNSANTGIGLDSINVSYFAGGGTANNPADANTNFFGGGLFGGRNSILAQVNFKPSDKFDFGLTYVNANHNGGAIYDFGSGGSAVGPNVGALNSNTYGASAAYKVNENFSLNGYIASTSANTVVGDRSLLTYGVGAAFPNIGQPGNLLGFFVGQPPTVTNQTGAASSNLQLEGFYKYKLNDNLSITPGLIYMSNPNQLGANSEGALIGTVRSTFTF